MENIKFVVEMITAVTAIVAIGISIYTIKQTQDESYLSHRAYVGPVSWTTDDNNTQFHIPFINSGNTPAINFYAIGNLIVDNTIFRSTPLTDGQILLPGYFGGTNPIVPFNFLKTDIERIMSSSNGYIQIEFGYIDYLNKSHHQKTNFKVFIVNGKYTIQPIRQIIID